MREVDFGRIFEFATSDTGRQYTEDFITEHLAVAIRCDPRPIAHALAPYLTIPPGPLDVVTQDWSSDESRIDITLVADGIQLAWLELKAWAGEHDGQLERYFNESQALDPSPLVVVIGPTHFAPSARVPHLSWNQIIRAVDTVESPSDTWLYVVGAINHFEIGGVARMPLTPEQTASPNVVNDTIAALVNFMHEVTSRLEATPKRQRWWKRQQYETMMRTQLRQHGRLVFEYEPIPPVEERANRRNGAKVKETKKLEKQANEERPASVWLGLENNEFVVTIYTPKGWKSGRVTDLLGSRVINQLKKKGWRTLSWPTELQISYGDAAGASEKALIDWTLDRFAEVESSGAYERMRAACDEWRSQFSSRKK